jgi:DNA-binding PadR family transcriptional regulator
LISLRRQIKVETFTALAEIGITDKREEILAILKLADKNQGYVDSSQVNTELLGRPAESAQGQRILMVVESYGLIEKAGTVGGDSYKLTDAGREDLQKGEIMVPEQGGYVLYTTKDPLFKERILRIERTTVVEDNESKGYFGSREDRKLLNESKSVARPDYLSDIERGHILRQVCKGNEVIQINSISEKVAPSKRELKVSVTLELAPNEPAKMKVKSIGSSTSDKELSTETLFDQSYMQVLQLLTQDIGRLDVFGEEPTLLMKWNNIKSREAEQFRKEITVDKPTFGEFGSFESLKLTIPIFPETQSDAIQWGNYLLKQSITTYLDESNYANLREMVAKKFSAKFEPERLSSRLIDFGEMLTQATAERSAGETTERYWFLVTPKDLTMR